MYCRMMAAMGGLILTWSSQYCSDPKFLAITVNLLSIHYFRLPEHAGAAFEEPHRPETSGGVRPMAPGPNIAGRPLHRVSPVRTWLRQ